MLAKLAIIVLSLLGEDRTSTDDSWNCWTEESGTLEVCERELWPCHYDVDESECVIVVKRVSVGTLKCDIDDPLACLLEA